MNTMPPIGIFSVSFENSIPLYDPATDQECNQAPQWTRSGSSSVVAYEQGASITLNVAFLDLNSQALEQIVTSVYAQYNGEALQPVDVALQFDPDSGITTSIPATFTLALPPAIGEHQYTLRWFANCCSITGEPLQPCLIGETTHTICTIWRRETQPAPKVHLYEPLMRWSCQWIMQQEPLEYTSKLLCDRLINNLYRSNLFYGLDGLGQTTRGVLLRGGGMCGALAKLFQSLALCQGVTLECYDLTLVRRRATPEIPNVVWQAAVTTSGGLNQQRPLTHESTYPQDSDQWPLQVPVTHFPEVTAYRYIFAGQDPELVQANPSTHTITILHDEEDWYIYDPSFAFGPAKVDAACFSSPMITGSALKTLKSAYLDIVFPYLLARVDRDVEITIQTEMISPDAITIAWKTAAA